MNGQSAEQGAGPVGQPPVRIELISVPAGSLSLPSVEPRRVCSNLLETATQPWPDLKGYGQLARARTGLYQGEKGRAAEGREEEGAREEMSERRAGGSGCSGEDDDGVGGGETPAGVGEMTKDGM